MKFKVKLKNVTRINSGFTVYPQFYIDAKKEQIEDTSHPLVNVPETFSWLVLELERCLYMYIYSYFLYQVG